MLVVIEKAFADASAAAKTGRDSFMVDRIGVGTVEELCKVRGIR